MSNIHHHTTRTNCCQVNYLSERSVNEIVIDTTDQRASCLKSKEPKKTEQTQQRKDV